MEIIEYSKKYNEQIKNLLVDLQEYLIKIDDWNTQVLYEQYSEESFKIDLRKVNEQEGKIYLAVENENIYGLIMGIVEIYVPNTISGDGEELDCYVLGVFEPIDIFKGKCIAIIHRLNDNDDKLIVVPDNLSYTNEQIKALTEFQERFFDSEILR